MSKRKQNKEKMNKEKLVLLATAEYFCIILFDGLKNMPAFERHALTAEIKRNLVNLITSIRLAESVKSKRLQYAQEADAYLESVMAMLRICRSDKLRYISNGFYTHLYEIYEKIKALLVGFIKSATRKN